MSEICLRVRLKQSFLDLLFPPRCVGCGRVGFWLCEQCWAAIEFVSSPVCALCGEPLSNASSRLCLRCRVAPLQIDGIRSVAYFEGVLRQAIHRFKYEGVPALAASLGELLHAGWQTIRPPGEVIVPVPLHPRRQRERGYNQAALLARSLGTRCGLPVLEETLSRVRDTPPQTGLNAQQRKENMREAFRCRDESLAGKQVLLIDDVCTTGATLEACSVALRRAKVRSVWALSLARPRIENRERSRKDATDYHR